MPKKPSRSTRLGAQQLGKIFVYYLFIKNSELFIFSISFCLPDLACHK